MVDSKGIPLRYTPDNLPTPPAGDGTQLSFKAIPHYESGTNSGKAAGVVWINLPYGGPTGKSDYLRDLPRANLPDNA